MSIPVHVNDSTFYPERAVMAALKYVVLGGAASGLLLWTLRRRRRSAAPGVDLLRYPIDDLSSAAARAMLSAARKSLAETGVASFPGFLTCEATAAAAEEARRSAPTAFVTDAEHTAWQLPRSPPVAIEHVRNLMMRTRVASIAYDELGPSLHALYNSEAVLRFVEAVVGREPNTMHQLADPLGACSVNVFKPGWSHAWHFDE